MKKSYVNVMDLVFNGGAFCAIKEKPFGDCIAITEYYNGPRNEYLYEFSYRGITLGVNAGCITVGSLDRVAAALRGRGEWIMSRFTTRNGWIDTHREWTPKEARILKKAGVWAF